MSSIYANFVAHARANGLILAPGGGTPGRETRNSSVYGRVIEASKRLDGYVRDLTGGREVAGQRIDSAAKGADRVKDARYAAHCLEWGNYFSDGDNQERRRYGGAGPNGRTDSASTTQAIAAEIASGRFDALVPMSSQGLVSILPDVYEYKHANLSAWDGEILPIDKTSVDPAAETYTWYEEDNVGVPRAASTYSTRDVPMVAGPAVQANRLGNIIPAMIGMETNFMEARREALGVRNGKPDFQLDRRKVEMCHRGLAEFAHFLWLYGDPLSGIDGLWTSPDIATLSLSGGPWAGKTSLAIYADLVNMLTIIPNSTQGDPGGGKLIDYRKVKIRLPPDQFQLLGQIMSSAASESILSYFLKTWKLREDQVSQVFEFKASNSQIYVGGPQGLSSDHALVTYEVGDNWDAKFIMPQPIEMPSPPRQTGTGETTFYHMRVGGMMVADARRMRYVVGM